MAEQRLGQPKFHYGWVVMIACALVMGGSMGTLSGGSIGV